MDEIRFQPVDQRDAKTHLRALHQFTRYVPVDDLLQQYFLRGFVHLPAGRQSSHPFRNAVIEERLAAFEADAHRRTVDLWWDILDEVGLHSSVSTCCSGSGIRAGSNTRVKPRWLKVSPVSRSVPVLRLRYTSR